MAESIIIENKIHLAEWLLQHYFVPNSVYNRSRVGVGTKAYIRINEAINIDLIRQHLAGDISLAAPSAYNGNSVTISIDIDTLDLKPLVRARDALLSKDLRFVASFSGSKGYHLTLFLNAPTPLYLVQPISKKVQNVLDRSGINYCGIYPTPEGIGGNCIALPLGIHPETGERCYFMDDNLNQVTNPNSFIGTIQCLDLTSSTAQPVVNKGTGEITTIYPVTISSRACINKLWNEGPQAPNTRHWATMVIANSIKISNKIAAGDKEGALLDWVNRTFEKSKEKGFINSGTNLTYAASEALRLIRQYDRNGTVAELCENRLFKPAMRSACEDEYQCKLVQNHGSGLYRLMRRLGVFAATNAKPAGLGKSAMAIYESTEDIIQDYPVFNWNGHKAFPLSIQQLLCVSSCSRSTITKNRKKLIKVGLLVQISKTDIPKATLMKYPPYLEFYYLPELSEDLIQAVLNKLRSGGV